MKLSEKGYLKIGNSIVGWFENGVAKVTFDPDKIEFEPDDFKGVVVLTVEEAKKIERKLFAIRRNHDRKGEDNGVRSVNKLISILRERIEQAEILK